MEQQAEPSTIWRHPAAPWLVGLGLVVAFLPVLMDLAEHMLSNPWARTALVFPWLAGVAVHLDRGGPDSESKRTIWTSFLLGVVLYLLAVGGDVIRVGRAALLMCVIGIMCGAGWTRPRATLVLLWAIPLPNTLAQLFSPGLETMWGRGAAILVPGVGFDGMMYAPSLVAGDASLSLVPADGGLALGFSLAGLGWFQSVTSGGSGAKPLGRALCWGASMVPIQAALVLAASVALAVGAAPSRARWLLEEAGWVGVLVVGLLLSIHAFRSDRARRMEAAAC